MFWNKVAAFYDFFEKLINRKCYNMLGERVAEFIEPTDKVLECACGTGAISYSLCKYSYALTATDFSVNMLKQAKRKCRKFSNVRFQQSNILNLKYKNGAFDKIVAGNVIHLLDEPQKALTDLERVCRKGGKIIIPTYVNISNSGKYNFLIKLIEFIGLNFKHQFTLESYKKFFEDLGYDNVNYSVIDGRMPCVIAVITNN